MCRTAPRRCRWRSAGARAARPAAQPGDGRAFEKTETDVTIAGAGPRGTLTAEDGTVALYSAVLPIIDFPEEIVFPGEAEWLRTLSTITKLGEYEREDGLTDFDDVPVGSSLRARGFHDRGAFRGEDGFH